MTTEMYSDTAIQNEVMAEMAFDPRVEPAEIGVRVVDGIVTLFGTVDSYAKRIAAQECAHRVRGVLAVVNELQVQLPALHKRTDEEIARIAASVLTWHVRIPHERIEVTVADGRVTLKGEVDWNYQRSDAERAVRTLTGVKEVINEITVRHRVSAADVRHTIQAALLRSATTDARRIGAEVKGSKVILHGVVRSHAERQDAERAAWSAAGVTDVENNLLIQP